LLAVEMIERFVRIRLPFYVWHGVESIGIMLAMLRMEPLVAQTLIEQLAALDEAPVFTMPRIEQTPATKDYRDSRFYRTMMRIGAEEVPETEWTDPRSDPIGWGW
jgi:hypothetical protein